MRLAKSIIITVVFCCLLCSTNRAQASESSLTVSPSILEQVTAPGHTSTSSAIITNTTNFPLPIKAQVDAFLSDLHIPKSQSSTYDASSWFSLYPADFILQPQERKEIKISIRPPLGTEPGGHYATIYFQPLIPTGVMAAGSPISLARIGILTFLVVPGDIEEHLSVSDIQTKPWSTFGPVDFSFTLSNSGNIHLLPIGTLTVKDFFGKVVYDSKLDPSIILPGTDKDQSLSWNTQLLFGRYSADLVVDYGTDHGSLHPPTIIFWVVPWPIILIIIVLLTLLYKIFIVHIDRLKLAIAVLKGQDVQTTQNTQTPLPQHSPRARRTHTHDSRPLRRHRRQSH